jgi:hypothetical protein
MLFHLGVNFNDESDNGNDDVIINELHPAGGQPMFSKFRSLRQSCTL